MAFILDFSILSGKLKAYSPGNNGPSIMVVMMMMMNLGWGGGKVGWLCSQEHKIIRTYSKAGQTWEKTGENSIIQKHKQTKIRITTTF